MLGASRDWLPRTKAPGALVALGRAGLALVVAAGVSHLSGDPPAASGDEREGDVVAYRLRAGAVQAMRDGEVAAAGDRIQLVYDAGQQEFGVLFSVDGAARVTLHHPARVAGSTHLERRSGPLPFSLVLDDAPLEERFYFVTSDAPLDAAALLAAAGDGRKPSFSLRKQERAPRRAEVR